MSLAGLPNLLCVMRMLLAIPVVWALVNGNYGWTLGLFVIAAVSDGLDGFLAKHYGWTSELGKLLDPVADKLLLVSVIITLTLVGMVPLWLAIVVVARDLVIGIGAGVYKWLFGPVEGQPTTASKVNTFFQLAYVILVVASAAAPVVPLPWVTALGATVFVTTVVSGVDYTATYIKKAIVVSRARRAAA
jgi:cardiolipin synthase